MTLFFSGRLGLGVCVPVGVGVCTCVCVSEGVGVCTYVCVSEGVGVVGSFSAKLSLKIIIAIELYKIHSIV